MEIPHVTIKSSGIGGYSYEVRDETGKMLPVESFELKVGASAMALAYLRCPVIVDELDVKAIQTECRGSGKDVLVRTHQPPICVVCKQPVAIGGLFRAAPHPAPEPQDESEKTT